MNGIEIPAAKVPKGTPPWAVGIVAVLCVCITWYITARGEIQSVIQNGQTIAVKRAETEVTTIESVLALVRSQGEQITSISISLGQSQAQVSSLQATSSNLQARVTSLEQQLSTSEKELAACEQKLLKCKG